MSDMNRLATYAYVQARLQARHGNRPDEHTWQRLEGIKELAGYLQNARRTVLRPWVLGLHAHDDHHVVETGLIQQFRDYIVEVAGWLPLSWRNAFFWVQYLPDLPVLQHLLSGNTASTWMLDDNRYKLYSMTNPEQRLAYLHQSVYAPLLPLWQSGMSLPDAWSAHWRSLWPQKDRQCLASMDRLAQLLRDHEAAFVNNPVAWAPRARAGLDRQLTVMFRKHSFQPVTAFIHLALVALDLERLRGEILQRALFAGQLFSGHGEEVA